MRFEIPSVKYEKSFVESLGDISDYMRLIIPADQIRQDFKAFVQLLHDYQVGKSLPDRWVPQTVYWIIEDEKYIGQLVIRHRVEPPDNCFFGHIGVYLIPRARNRNYPLILARKAISLCRELFQKGIFEPYESGILATCDSRNPYTPRLAKAFGFSFLRQEPCPQMGEGVIFKYFLYKL